VEDESTDSAAEHGTCRYVFDIAKAYKVLGTMSDGGGKIAGHGEVF